MKIYLVGVAGFPNYGDELLLKNWVHYLFDKYPDAEIWVDVPTPTIIHNYFSSKNIKVTNAVWRLAWDYYRGNEDKLDLVIQDKLVNLATPAYDLSLLNLRDIDIFHVIGGGYINNLWEHNIVILHIAKVLKEKFHIKIYGTGLGFLPLIKRIDNYPELLSVFDYIESRDMEGASILGIKYGYDDAYLNYLPQKGEYSLERVPDVMICIQHSIMEPELFLFTVKLVKERIIEHKLNGLTVGYIEAIPGEDRIAFEYFSELIESDMFFTALEVIQNGLPLKDNQIWYSTRFHHHLEVSLFGLKGVAITLNKGYYDVKHGSLLKNGTGWALWNGTADLPYPQFDNSFVSNSKGIIAAKNSLAGYLYPDISSNDDSSELVKKSAVDSTNIKYSLFQKIRMRKKSNN